MQSRGARCAGWLFVAALAACATPTQPGPRPLLLPLQSGARLLGGWLGPRTLLGEAAAMHAGATAVIAGELDGGTLTTTAPTLAAEVHRLPSATAATKRLLGDERDRLGALRHSRGFTALDPRPDCVDLAAALHRWPELLQLDRRPMGEPEDLQHRTDPADREPVPGFGARLLRRLLP